MCEVQGQQEECSVKNVLDIVLIRCARHTKYLRESHNDITLDYNMKRSKILACCIFDRSLKKELCTHAETQAVIFYVYTRVLETGAR